MGGCHGNLRTRTRYTVVLSFWGDEPETAVHRVNSYSPAGAIKTVLSLRRISEEDVDDAVVFQGHLTELGHLDDILHGEE